MFDQNWWGALIPLALAVGAVIFASRRRNIDEDRSGARRIRSRRRRIVSSVISFVVVVVACQSVIAIGSVANNQGHQERSAGEEPITEAFGFVSGKKYPLTLGQENGVSELNAHGQIVLIFASGSVHQTSGPAETISYVNGSDVYPLSIPALNTTFHFSDTEKPWVRVYLDTDNLPTLDVTKVENDKPCIWRYVNLFLSCQHTAAISTSEEVTPLTAKQKQASLGAWIPSYVVGAEITLSRKMYNQLIGKIG